MHRHLPALCRRRCGQRRAASSATATLRKPTTRESPRVAPLPAGSDSSVRGAYPGLSSTVQIPLSSKWNRPQASAGPSKWARPAAPHSSGPATSLHQMQPQETPNSRSGASPSPRWTPSAPSQSRASPPVNQQLDSQRTTQNRWTSSHQQRSTHASENLAPSRWSRPSTSAHQSSPATSSMSSSQTHTSRPRSFNPNEQPPQQRPSPPSSAPPRHQPQQLSDRPRFGPRPTEPPRFSTPSQHTNAQNTQSVPETDFVSIESSNLDKESDRTRRSTRQPFQPRESPLRTKTRGKPKALTKADIVRKKKAHALLPKKVSADVYIPSVVSVGALAQLLGVKLEWLQKRMKRAGMGEETSHDHVLTSEYAVLLAEEFGRNPIVNDEMAFDIYPTPLQANSTTLPHRPPIVTIMGHVDHGKTTLLDSLRSTSVAKGEAGGITQHIGAFSVPVPGSSQTGPKTITFLDTPGHAAFSAMRARGAQVTDIIVLVVAADDGIKPQTREVLNLIKQEKDVGVLVAVNKVDKQGADIDKVHKELMAEGLEVEVFGGDVPSVPVSGLTRKGLPELVETLSVMAEMQDLRAEQDGPVHGYIIESKVQKGLGAVATVLVTRGTLKPGSNLISGLSHAKVRVMTDSSGKPIKTAGPGTPVTVSGWKTVPNAGDGVLEGSESDIKKALANRTRKAELEASLSDVEAINQTRRQEREKRAEEVKVAEETPRHQRKAPRQTGPVIVEDGDGRDLLNLVIKSDVSGSAEAVSACLECIGNDIAGVKVLSSTVGDVTESDITLAKTSGGAIVAFSVPVSKAMQNLAAKENVLICSSNIIYRLIESVTGEVVKLLPVTIRVETTAEATVLATFNIKQNGSLLPVAGCRVNSGLLKKSPKHFAKVLRNGKVIHEESLLDTLKHLKTDVMEIKKGTECGLTLTKFAELLPGDTIQIYEKIEVPGVL